MSVLLPLYGKTSDMELASTKRGGLQRGASPLAMFSLGVPVSLTYIKEMGTYVSAPQRRGKRFRRTGGKTPRGGAYESKFSCFLTYKIPHD